MANRDRDYLQEQTDAIYGAAVPGAKITSIVPTKRDTTRAMVRVAPEPAEGGRPRKGKVAVTLSLRHIDELGLRIGDAWTPELASQVVVVAVYDRALRQAIDRVNRKMMSRRELGDKLRALGYDAQVRERVLDRLEELGLLNDRTYAEALVRSAMSGKPAGPRLLKQKLFQKGVPQDISDAVVHAATADDDQQLEDAIALCRKKLKSMMRLDATTRRRRLYGQLGRRGFDLETINRALEAVNDMLQGEEEF